MNKNVTFSILWMESENCCSQVPKIVCQRQNIDRLGLVGTLDGWTTCRMVGFKG